MAKKITCLLLSLVLVCALFLPVYATEEKEAVSEVVYENSITIDSLEEFLSFAQACMLDSYSRSLQVTLTKNIDLSGTDFSGVPVFCGSFDGNGYTISGLNLTFDGSHVGLFRYLTDTAIVKNLTVSGTVAPAGSRDYTGGIAGENAGLIENCVFSGTVSASDNVGAIAGINRVTGIIDNCRSEGQVQGDHFIGGIAGENLGVIRRCINSALINTTPQQNSVELSDITMESLTSSESANTVTDVGGIAGTSSGVIRDCDNFASVGYRQMGYNIGGITGSQMGYIVDCQNFGHIAGRKEVGGIVGQMEPVTSIIYTTDTLQILQQQLDTLGSLAGSASAHAQSSASAITAQIVGIQDNVQNAKDAVESLLPGSGNLPNLDSIQAAQNALSSSLRGVQSGLQKISSTAQSAAATLARDMQSLMGQIGVMGATLKNAQENLGGSLTDVSDNDTPEDTTGKVERCTNYASVLADLNAGGIAGTISPENDLDPEGDVEVTGESSLNFEGEMRAVILDCENTAAVTVNKQSGGGIIGSMVMGLVKNCLNTGTLNGSNADYVGGIAGQSFGFIRQSNANCILSGSTYVGGIAGSADTVTDCRSMVQLSAAEKAGAVLGFAENREEISGNFYLTLEEDPGAIDGISYDGCAQSLTAEAFLALEELPSVFHRLTVTFVFDDGTEEKVFLTPGESLTQADIPNLPEKPGYSAAWEGLPSLDIAFDTAVYAVYTPYISVMESNLQGKNGLPVLLAEGSFLPGEVLTAADSTDSPALQRGQTLVGCLDIALPQSVTPVRLRCLIPDGTEVASVLIKDSAGLWQEAAFHIDGSYLVLDVPADAAAIAITEAARLPVVYYIAAAVFVLCAVLVILHFKKKSKA